MEESDSKICRFFDGQTIFLTGGTGFLGKVVLEKLLRTCRGVEKIYMLVRPKKGKTREERFATLFDFPCFDRLKKERPDFKPIVKLISGDCEVPELGLTPRDVELLKKEVSCVIHASANVKFDQTLKEAAHNNVRPLKVLIEMAKEMPLLQSFIFVSTAYSNCNNKYIEEKFYDPPMSAEKLLDLVDLLNEKTLEGITPQILGEWPNTYVFTKSIAENLVATQGKDLPIAIVRPGIVTSSMKEPMPGWIDNFYGVVGIVLAASLGILRSLHAKPDSVAWLVPVDYVCNIVLTAAWDTAENRDLREQGQIPIYNFVGHDKIRVTWRRFMQYIEESAWDYPTPRQVWYYFFELRENLYWHKTCIFFLHTVPAYIADFVLICLGRPTLAVENYARLNKLLELISYFSCNSFDFEVEKAMALWDRMTEKDQELFRFCVFDDKHFTQYTKDSIIGGRLYLLKEPLDTIPAGQKKMMYLRIAHYTVVVLVLYLFYKFVMFLLRLVF